MMARAVLQSRRGHGRFGCHQSFPLCEFSFPLGNIGCGILSKDLIDLSHLTPRIALR